MSDNDQNPTENDLYDASLRIKLKLVTQLERLLDGEPNASVLREARQMLQGMGLFDMERQKHSERVTEHHSESVVSELISGLPEFPEPPTFPKVRSVDD